MEASIASMEAVEASMEGMEGSDGSFRGSRESLRGSDGSFNGDFQELPQKIKRKWVAHILSCCTNGGRGVSVDSGGREAGSHVSR